MPSILHAATEAPTPEPQTSTPRVGLAAQDRLTDSARPLGVVDAHGVGVDAEVDRSVPGVRDRAEHRVPQLHPPVVEAAATSSLRDPRRRHQPTRARSASASAATRAGVKPSSS